MPQIVLIHYGELALKRGNRAYFEKRLIRNIKDSLRDLGRVRMQRLFGRFLLETDEIPWPALQERLSQVFGISSFAPVAVGPLTWEGLLEATKKVLPEGERLSFGVRAKKADERWSRGRSETERDLGAWIQERTGWSVNLRQPDVWVRAEVANGRVIVSARRYPGRRGLPVGVSGRALALLSGGIDSPVAAWMMQSRGLHLSFVHFHSAPYTTRRSQEKVKDLARRLLCYQPSLRLHMVPFADLQQSIVTRTPEAYRVILYRRFMMRIANRIAHEDGAGALVSGESLGQVASQTLTNIHTVDEASELTVLRPLVGLDKETIIRRAQDIGTFEISIEPHDDCCSFLMPHRPVTKTKPGELERVEEDLDVAGLVNGCLENISTETFRLGRADIE